MKAWGFDPNDGPAVILSKEEHAKYTRRLRKLLPYGKLGGYDKEEVWKAYLKVYGEHPAWLDAVRRFFP